MYFFDKLKPNSDDTFNWAREFALNICMCAPYRQPIRSIIMVCVASYYYIGLTGQLLLKESTVNQLVYYSHASASLYYLLLWMNKRTVLSLVRRASSIYIYPDERQRKIHRTFSCQRKLKETFYAVTFSCYLAYTIVLTFPLIVFILLTASDSSNKFKSTYDTFLIAPIWNPYEIDSVQRYFLTYGLQFVVLILNGITFLSALCLYYYFNDIGRTEVRSLARVIAATDNVIMKEERQQRNRSSIIMTTIEECRRDENLNGVTTDDQVYSRLMLNCFHHHKTIIAFTKDIISSYKWIMFAAACITFSNVAINFYLIIMDDNRALIMERVITPFMCIFMFFFFCHAAQYYTEINAIFSDAVYSTEWYGKSLKAQKVVLLLLSVTSWELRMSFTPNSFLSHALYSSTMKGVYTFLNFLLNSKST